MKNYVGNFMQQFKMILSLYAPSCLNACLTKSEHDPNETTDGVLGDLLSGPDQIITPGQSDVQPGGTGWIKT